MSTRSSLKYDPKFHTELSLSSSVSKLPQRYVSKLLCLQAPYRDISLSSSQRSPSSSLRYISKLLTEIYLQGLHIHMSPSFSLSKLLTELYLQAPYRHISPSLTHKYVSKLVTVKCLHSSPSPSSHRDMSSSSSQINVSKLLTEICLLAFLSPSPSQRYVSKLLTEIRLQDHLPLSSSQRYVSKLLIAICLHACLSLSLSQRYVAPLSASLSQRSVAPLSPSSHRDMSPGTSQRYVSKIVCLQAPHRDMSPRYPVSKRPTEICRSSVSTLLTEICPSSFSKLLTEICRFFVFKLSQRYVVELLTAICLHACLSPSPSQRCVAHMSPRFTQRYVASALHNDWS